MNSFQKAVLSLLLLAFGAIFTGCAAHTSRDSAIPWSRPANWEAQVPGMGTGPGQGR